MRERLFNSHIVIIYLIYALIAILIPVVFRNIPFFGDSVTFGSKLASFLYYNGLFNWDFPISIDTGHPPFLPFITSLSWKVFGRSLIVSHFIMVPFIFGFLVQLHKLVELFSNKTPLTPMLVFFVVMNPPITAHLIHINHEIIILFFSLLAINNLIRKNTLGSVIGLTLLTLVNYRGMLIAFGIFLYELFYYCYLKKQSIRDFFNQRRLVTYSLSAIPSITYVVSSYLIKSRILADPQSGWWRTNGIIETWHELGFKLIGFVHKLIDFGNIALFIVLLIFFVKTFKRKKNDNIYHLLVLSFFPIIAIFFINIFRKIPLSHHYYLLTYVFISILSQILIINRKKYIFKYVILVLILFTGNFWIYPYRVAQGWNSSLASLPYFKLRSEMLCQIDELNIPFDSVGTFFPNRGVIDEIDLSGDSRKLTYFSWKNKYVLWSNVYNLTDDEFSVLYHYYDDIVYLNKNGIDIVLFERNEDNPY